jgi:hypothetical protein
LLHGAKLLRRDSSPPEEPEQGPAAHDQ